MNYEYLQASIEVDFVIGRNDKREKAKSGRSDEDPRLEESVTGDEEEEEKI